MSGDVPVSTPAPKPRCRRREYSGDGVYYECRLPRGHDGAHDYGFGVGRRVPPLGS